MSSYMEDKLLDILNRSHVVKANFEENSLTIKMENKDVISISGGFDTITGCYLLIETKEKSKEQDELSVMDELECALMEIKKLKQELAKCQELKKTSYEKGRFKGWVESEEFERGPDLDPQSVKSGK